MVKPLIVYKASAGSGKTFTLASEFIRLLVVNPQQYRSILAVTFTNKATEEMKMRILSQLYGIWKRLDDSKDYLRRICELTGYEEKVVRERAGLALHNLLHHYSYFRVSTIDTFFQSVLRNLARELELTASLRVELNDEQVEAQAVDEIIQDLQRTDLVLQWILRYVMEQIDDNSSWNVVGSIKRFGKTIFKDFYKDHHQQLSQKMQEEGFFERFTKELQKRRGQAVLQMKVVGEQFFKLLEDNGLKVEDLSRGNYIASFFIKLQNGVFDESIVTSTIKSRSEDGNSWCRKNDEEKLLPIVELTLKPFLQQALEQRRSAWRNYQSATLTLRHLNQLRLLGEIERKVRVLNQDANRFLLSDTQYLLHALIAQSDTPFIFEKIGAQLEHIMIDEFQDTSTVQWKNFQVLLEECMSHEGSQNLIVGDVKQSIYRWRSGDWRLLNDITSHFQHADSMMQVETLKTNYRSRRNVIDFNNLFFTKAAQKEYNNVVEKAGEDMARQVNSAYADVEQLIPERREKEGLVSVTLFPSENYKERVLEKTLQIIQELTSQGIRQQDMAILIRTKDTIPLLVEYFAARMPSVNIVSDEAFRLDASVSVTLLINALQYLAHPDDLVAKASLVKKYQQLVMGRQDVDAELLRKDVNTDSYLPMGYVTDTSRLLSMPLYDLMQRLYQLFSLESIKSQDAYLCAFYDYLNAYITDNSSDLESFLQYWEESLCSRTIQSDEVDGIRVLTIHKSKGLEFEHVILPFCDWKLEHGDQVIWCQASEYPYNELPLVPVDYSSKMVGSTYEQAYFEEYVQNRVDNLNLLYVAFTRAMSNLFVIGRKGNASSRSQLIQEVLPEVQQLMPEATLSGMDNKEEPLEFEFGTLCTRRQEKKTSDNVFLKTPKPCEVTVRAHDSKTTFRQSNKSRDFIEGEEKDSENHYIRMGSILHEVFSHIRTLDDIAPALHQLQMDGVLYDQELTEEQVERMIRQRLSDPRVQDWFSGRWKLFNECTILSLDEKNQVVERRPDRVMMQGEEVVVVDFKFGKPDADYHRQVREYMQLLRDMGHRQVKGYLWYVYSNQIEEVK